MYTIPLLRELLSEYPEFRYRQAYKALFVDQYDNWNDVSVLPKDLRLLLGSKFHIIPNENVNFSKSGDSDTEKILIQLDDGAYIESVLMKYGDIRNTVCVSTQVGCAMGCAFCATGKLGLTRNLTAWEIVQQVLIFSRKMKKNDQRISNVVFMGMGEPFENYEHVMSAIRILNDHDGMDIGARKISISTCGLIPEINRFAKEGLEVNLAISLHAADQEKRKKIMPIATKYPIKELMNATDEYISRTNRKVMIEYILLKGINDTKDDAVELVNLLKGKLCMVNLISYNETGSFDPPEESVVKKFKDILSKGGLEVTQRYRFGSDIKAACGQLAATKTVL